MDTVLTVAFVLAATAFFKERLGLEDKLALLCAFVVALGVSFAPMLDALLPNFAPFIDATVRTFLLFLSAAGGYDLLVDIKTKEA